MPELQFIHFRGQLAAVVVDDRAAVSDQVPEEDLATVNAMCVYALEIAAGERSGPYRDVDALDYANRLLPVSAGAHYSQRPRVRRPR